jgi:hypothetical protein
MELLPLACGLLSSPRVKVEAQDFTARLVFTFTILHATLLVPNNSRIFNGDMRIPCVYRESRVTRPVINGIAEGVVMWGNNACCLLRLLVTLPRPAPIPSQKTSGRANHSCDLHLFHRALSCSSAFVCASPCLERRRHRANPSCQQIPPPQRRRTATTLSFYTSCPA